VVKFKDYYLCLGMTRNASPDEIKSAYRRLARQFHPDLNPGDAAAEERFREIQEAYDVLGDPKKRRQYDSLGANYQAGMDFRMPADWGFRPPDDTGPQATPRGGFSDFFEMLFGGPRPRQRPQPNPASGRGNDIETVLSVTIEDVFAGASKKIRYHIQTRCTACQGRGKMADSPCSACEGRGVAPTLRTLEIKIPQTVQDGTRLRLAGQGHPPTNGSGQPGDMHVQIRFQPHPVFKPQGRNIHVELPVAPWEAVLGGEVEVPTLDGTVTMKLPPGSPAGMKMRLRDRGLRTENGRGDEIVTVIVVVPQEVTDRERHLFRQLRDISHFRPRVKNRNGA